MTLKEQIAAFEAKRAANVARRKALQELAITQGRGKNDAEREEFATLSSEIEAIDAELIDLKLLEKAEVQAAATVPAAAGNDPAAGAAARGGEGGGAAQPARRQESNIILSRSNEAPGVDFARFAMAMFRGQGNPSAALNSYREDKVWMKKAPHIERALMSAVNAGDTTTAGWASEWAYQNNFPGEFVEYLRPKTIIGRIPNFARVPFNIRIGGATGAPTGYWVGQGKPIPMSKPTSTSLTLGIAKAAGLVAIDEELARLSTPSAEMLVRDLLADSVIEFLDDQFINPNNGGQTNISPASVLYGVSPVTPTGTTYAALRTDIQTMMEAALDANLDMSQAVWVMSATLALKLAMMVNALDQKVNPDLSVTGGTFLGLPAIVSQKAQIAGSPQFNDILVLLHPRQILLADDGGVTVSVSREASIQMDDAPTNQSTATATGTSVVSMFQTESLAIKAVRYINWKAKRSTCVQWIQNAAYV